MSDLRRHIEEATEAKKAGGLPPSALEVLEEASERFGDKLIVGAQTQRFSLPDTMRALAAAQRHAAGDQVAACVYLPKNGTPLVTLRTQDLAQLLKLAEQRSG